MRTSRTQQNNTKVEEGIKRKKGKETEQFTLRNCLSFNNYSNEKFTEQKADQQSNTKLV